MKEFEFTMSYTLAEVEQHTEGMAHIEMKDNSMKPRLRKGDYVIYDTYRKNICGMSPTPLVVKLNGETLVREAVEDSSGLITLRSCSRKVPPIVVKDDDDLVIVGRVYGAMRFPPSSSRMGKNVPLGIRPHALIEYPQPHENIMDDPMGLGISGPDAFSTPPPDETLSDDARALLGMNPALFAIGSYLRDAPEDAIGRYEMPDESMMDFISPGDVLLCDKRLNKTDPKHALLYVVRLDGLETVREVWRDKRGCYRTRPMNDDFPSYIIEDGDDFEIIGKLISVMELSLRYSESGEEINNMKMKLLPTPRKISVSEP